MYPALSSLDRRQGHLSEGPKVFAGRHTSACCEVRLIPMAAALWLERLQAPTYR